jgi:Tfp pilus assembly protein PilN
MRAVNLLPREPVRSKRTGGPSVHAQLSVACPLLAVVLVGAVWFFVGSRLPSKRDTLAGLQAELARMPAPKRVVPQDPAVRLAHDQRVSALAGALDGRIAWDRILRHVAAVLPTDVWLTNLHAGAPADTSSSQTAPATTAPAATTAASTPDATASAADELDLDGYTYSQNSVARLLSRLGVVPDLIDVQLRSSKLGEIGKRPVVEFSIVAAVRSGSGSA